MATKKTRQAFSVLVISEKGVWHIAGLFGMELTNQERLLQSGIISGMGDP